jgi:hypothetical protein
MKQPIRPTPIWSGCANGSRDNVDLNLETSSVEHTGQAISNFRIASATALGSLEERISHCGERPDRRMSGHLPEVAEFSEGSGTARSKPSSNPSRQLSDRFLREVHQHPPSVDTVDAALFQVESLEIPDAGLDVGPA